MGMGFRLQQVQVQKAPEPENGLFNDSLLDEERIAAGKKWCEERIAELSDALQAEGLPPAKQREITEKLALRSKQLSYIEENAPSLLKTIDSFKGALESNSLTEEQVLDTITELRDLNGARELSSAQQEEMQGEPATSELSDLDQSSLSPSNFNFPTRSSNIQEQARGRTGRTSKQGIADLFGNGLSPVEKEDE